MFCVGVCILFANGLGPTQPKLVHSTRNIGANEQTLACSDFLSGNGYGVINRDSPKTKMLKGRFLGIAQNVGDAFF